MGGKDLPVGISWSQQQRRRRLRTASSHLRCAWWQNNSPQRPQSHPGATWQALKRGDDPGLSGQARVPSHVSLEGRGARGTGAQEADARTEAEQERLAVLNGWP